nr:MAG TPA: hypothetical protein [Caudoviricetes sp.]
MEGRAERRRVVRKFRTAWRRSFYLQEGSGEKRNGCTLRTGRTGWQDVCRA